MEERHTSTHAWRGYVRLVLHGLLFAAAVAVCATATPAAAEPSPSSEAIQPYYVVGPPVDGRREFLYDIAVKTLGDGNRYREIFDLNQGRVQPDGGRLTDVTDVRPGWVLVLPPDAKGPMVRVGTVPAGTVPAGPSTRAPQRPGRQGGGAPVWIGGTGLVLAAGLAWTVRAAVVRRRRPSPRPVVVDRTRAVPRTLAPSAAGTPPVRPALAPAPPRMARAATSTEAAPPADLGDLGDLGGRLMSDGIAWQINLTGYGVPARTPTYRLLERFEAPPPGIMPVILGTMNDLRLCVDLGRVPGVFTIIGRPEDCRRQTQLIIDQVFLKGLSVLVVDDVFGGENPYGCVPVPAFPEDLSAIPPGLVIGAGLHGAHLRAVRALPARTEGRVVPVMIGNVLRSGWSLRSDA